MDKTLFYCEDSHHQYFCTPFNQEFVTAIHNHVDEIDREFVRFRTQRKGGVWKVPHEVADVVSALIDEYFQGYDLEFDQSILEDL